MVRTEAMAAKDELPICDFCRVGPVIKRTDEMAFRQWSDKGYVRCRVTLMIGVCSNCQARALDSGADKLFDDAFQREYEKLSCNSRENEEGRDIAPPSADIAPAAGGCNEFKALRV
jgi:hypothetical protein